MTERCIVAKWKCPICKVKGRKWLSAYRARRNFQSHRKIYHPDKKVDPIIIKKKINR